MDDHVQFCHSCGWPAALRIDGMVLLVLALFFVLLAVGAVCFGADSRDGRDWTPQPNGASDVGPCYLRR